MDSNPTNSEDQVPSLPPPELDVETYREELASLGMTTEQENKLLETLWNIMRIMVDIGYGMDAVQMVVPALMNGSVENSTDKDKPANITANFNDHAKPQDENQK